MKCFSLYNSYETSKRIGLLIFLIWDISDKRLSRAKSSDINCTKANDTREPCAWIAAFRPKPGRIPPDLNESIVYCIRCESRVVSDMHS